MIGSRVSAFLVVTAALAAVALAGGGGDGSIGICTRKDEFAKRQQALDAKVAQLSKADDARRKPLVASLVKAADAEIECLIRYREPALAPVFVDLLKNHKKWFTRTRAAYALKMLGDRSTVPALTAALSDKDGMVRESAANALGHLGGDAARTALETAKTAESDAYVAATLAAAIATASARPYESRADKKTWQETLVGPDGAKRVEWTWLQKGSPLFNDCDRGPRDTPVATRFVFPVQRYKEDLFAGFPRNSFGAGGTHAGEDHAWFREGCSYYAIADGVVRMVQGAGGDWGFLVLVEHRLADGRYVCAVYGHSAFDVLVKPGDSVTCGQRIATQGLSCAVENGGYGSHVHFGLGDGPFRRPSKIAAGDVIDFDAGGKKARGPVLRLVYAKEGTGSTGAPLTAAICKAPDGAETEVVFPEEDLQKELTWFQAYVKDCRGWLDPQKLLPEWVERGAKSK